MWNILKLALQARMFEQCSTYMADGAVSGSSDCTANVAVIGQVTC